MPRPPPSSTLFPYTTLFRSRAVPRGLLELRVHPGHVPQYRRAGHADRARDGSRTGRQHLRAGDRKSTRLNSSHTVISYAVFCLKKKKKTDVECAHVACAIEG